MTAPNQHPEQKSRDQIDQLLQQAGWAVQNIKQMNFSAALGVAVREFQTDVGPADYVLFVDGEAVGVIEAKPETMARWRKQDKPRALIQMATGAGKTFTAITSSYRLLKEPLPVGYNANVPPEFFDVIITDECHCSIYNLWRQVLEYFDAYLVGLTATPDNRTYGFFRKNVVSEYDHEKAVADGVNVGNEVFIIETEKTLQQGGTITAKQQVAKRWALQSETYSDSQPDRIWSATTTGTVQYRTQ